MSMDNFTDNIVDIDTTGGYTFQQVMNNKNCSKLPCYWYLIKSTMNSDCPKYLFKSNCAESFEFWDPNIVNPVRNTNIIYLKFKDVTAFVEPSNHFRTHNCYTRTTPDTVAWNKYWDDLEDKIENGLEVDGVRITGRHFFMINFGRFRSIPVDEYGNAISHNKVWTFLRFLDHQYYLMHELEECLLEGPYKTWKEYKEWFPLQTNSDYLVLKLQSFVLAKARRKGWTAAIAVAIFNYNFTFIESSMNILAAYEKSHYGAMLSAIHTTKTFLDKNTPWKRRTDIKGTNEHIIAGIEVTDQYGMKLREGYLSEIQAYSFKDNAFRGIGQSATVINIEECLSPETKVLMFDGTYKEIQNIKLNEYVMGIDGLPKKVINLTSGETEMFEVIQHKGINFKCTKNHKLYLEQRTKCKHMAKYDGDVIFTPEQLELFRKENKYLGRTIYSKKWKGVEFKFSNVNINPYYLGLWLGDGSSRRGDIVVNKELDFELIDFLNDYADYLDLNLIEYIIKKDKLSTYYFESIKNKNVMTRLLKSYNLLKNKHIPKEYLFNSKETRLQVLAGLIDSDGYLAKKKNNKSLCYELVLKDSALIDNINFLCQSLGFSTTISIKKVKNYPNNIYKRIRIVGKLNEIPIKIKRKKVNSDFNTYNEIYSSSINIYDIGINKYNGFTLEGSKLEDHLFILEDGTITHNCGKFDNLQTAYQVSMEPLIRDGETTIGIAIAGGTAGDMEGGGSTGLAELIHKPKAYGFKAYSNIYEAQDIPGEVGWFIDDMWYSPIRVPKEEMLKIDSSDKTKELLDKFEEDYVDCVDIHGNSYRYFSELILDRKREDRRRISSIAYQKFITQQPKYLSEAFLLNESSPFDTATAKEVLGQLVVEKIGDERGVFSILDGKPHWRLDMSLNAVDEYPYKGHDTTGCWIIYEHPITVNGEIPSWRYVSGCDPIDWGSDEVSSTGVHSFAATYIIDTITRNIVAEYVGRPVKADNYFEQLWRGLEYYNALLLYENNLKALFSYFKLKNRLYLLANEPESLKSRWGYKASNRTKGFHATPASNSYARELIHTWSLEEVLMHQDDEGQAIFVPRMYFIKSKGLLQEIITYNSKGNFDRISGLGAAMILLFDRTYEETDFQKSESIMEKGIFAKVKDIMNKKRKFNFNINGN